MNDFIKDIFFRLRKALVFILFVLVTMLVVYFYPREGKFQYEFQKGEPWMHEILIAPFDFPIYKSERELQKERDSVLREFKPYFRYNEEIIQENLDEFDGHFELIWTQYFRNDSSEKYVLDQFNSSQISPQALKSRCYHAIDSAMKEVYQTGIIDVNDLSYGRSRIDSVITTLRGNVAEERKLKSLYTPRSAYETVLSSVQSQCIDNLPQHELMSGFIQDLDLNRFILPNLFYDAETSKKMKEEMLDNISLTRGMVQAGERIIMKGDLVNSNKYQILLSLKKEYEKRLGSSSNYYLVLIGQLMLIGSIMFVMFLFLLNFKKEILQNTRDISFILLLVSLLVIVAGLATRYTNLNIYLIPFTILPIIIWTFFDARVATFIHFSMILLIGFMVPNSFEFILLNFITGIVAIFSLKNLYRRGKLFLTSGVVVLTYCFVYFGLNMIQEGDLGRINWYSFAWFGGNGLLVLSSYPLIYLFEKTFGFLSDNTLMELSDTNQPLLRKLAEKAPGTFQHSLQVANLAEEAIINIGGNSLLVRTGALYHDIGKMNNPIYFIENQVSNYNPHDGMDFEESAKKIISHVADGVKIARRNNLPEPLIDFIRTHHGTSKVKYFYRSFINTYPGEDVDESIFTYPGPKPFSKETAVLMMADSVEAASRSLKELNAKTLNELVENIIDDHINTGQFDNTEITFKSITTIKNIFKRKLVNIYHVRIEYPEESSKQKSTGTNN